MAASFERLVPFDMPDGHQWGEGGADLCTSMFTHTRARTHSNSNTRTATHTRECIHQTSIHCKRVVVVVVVTLLFCVFCAGVVGRWQPLCVLCMYLHVGTLPPRPPCLSLALRRTRTLRRSICRCVTARRGPDSNNAICISSSLANSKRFLIQSTLAGNGGSWARGGTSPLFPPPHEHQSLNLCLCLSRSGFACWRAKWSEQL